MPWNAVASAKNALHSTGKLIQRGLNSIMMSTYDSERAKQDVSGASEHLSEGENVVFVEYEEVRRPYPGACNPVVVFESMYRFYVDPFF